MKKTKKKFKRNALYIPKAIDFELHEQASNEMIKLNCIILIIMIKTTQMNEKSLSI